MATDRQMVDEEVESGAPVVRAVERVRSMCALRDEPTVIRFLKNHPATAKAVLDAIPLLRAEYGPDVTFSLEVVTDPEDELAPSMLYLSVQTCLHPDEAFKKNLRFVEAWVARTPRGEFENLVVGNEFRAPAA